MAGEDADEDELQEETVEETEEEEEEGIQGGAGRPVPSALACGADAAAPAWLHGARVKVRAGHAERNRLGMAATGAASTRPLAPHRPRGWPREKHPTLLVPGCLQMQARETATRSSRWGGSVCRWKAFRESKVTRFLLQLRMPALLPARPPARPPACLPAHPPARHAQLCDGAAGCWEAEGGRKGVLLNLVGLSLTVAKSCRHCSMLQP